MAKAKTTYQKTTVKGGGTNNGASDTVACNVCRGTGRVKKGYNKKQKKKRK